ncbi:hypothetical protein [Mycolicibacterium murale]|nr:hypothetical protein [Mycolicibacterium murale]MCV7180423.1 hypothetical protein [Mycolicibacterium murale]
MTGKAKLQARRRAREAQARANEHRATRERENVEDAATYVVAVDKLREIDAWEVSRLAAVCEQVRREAETRRTEHRAASRAALTRMQRRGETLTMITELTGESVAVIRATLRRAPSAQDHTAPTIVAISGASDDATTSGVMVAVPTPVKDTPPHHQLP